MTFHPQPGSLAVIKAGSLAVIKAGSLAVIKAGSLAVIKAGSLAVLGMHYVCLPEGVGENQGLLLWRQDRPQTEWCWEMNSSFEGGGGNYRVEGGNFRRATEWHRRKRRTTEDYWNF
jgi:hypothetical protein